MVTPLKYFDMVRPWSGATVFDGAKPGIAALALNGQRRP
jgi:hypothetical protein